ncbi:putative ATPase of the ABC class [Hyella patelloides LEGE 07179]|uniref:Putative ATPase of the ABC class n=1 Tax=Hyella patelloides LEGE 07179 TaxID=945734 RepID=A0A563VRP9_9CYAN|nr:ABC-ATPase domain-containing protein [Hyella patelloides]VEP14096.1 putative ATPase of the ABC class [Hyella patelloides LEGE 07179]
MSNAQNLRNILQRIDGAGYKAYKDIKGSYQFDDFSLICDRIQGDPFASPSKLRVKIPQAIAKFPTQLYKNKSREIALRDYITREFATVASNLSTRRGTGKSGLIAIASCGQEVLERTSVLIDDEYVEIRFVVGLPARGRRVLGRQATAMLCEDIPDIVSALLYDALDKDALQQQVETVEDADYIREQLPSNNLVAFVPNSAILPRRSGVDFRPLTETAIPFKSPPDLEVEFNCPNRGIIKGMGIPQGITLIVGGGYHGKSTLLKAIELGVYNQIPGDGRELVVTNPNAVKIRAEDGRSVTGVDISPFINLLPGNRTTNNFSTTNASGSTSQAANIIEALEANAKLLLIDEDTSATNFTIRDRRMQMLIVKEKEPITPFIDKVKQLYNDYGVSTILVMGGSGDYFEVADTVIAMDSYLPHNATTKAKAIAKDYPTERQAEGGTHFGTITPRIPVANSIDPSTDKRDVKTKVRDLDTIIFGKEDIELNAVEQLVDNGQLKAIAAAMIYCKQNYLQQPLTISQILNLIDKDIATKGLDIINEYPSGELAFFRSFELAAAINRLRSLEVKQKFK